MHRKRIGAFWELGVVIGGEDGGQLHVVLGASWRCGIFWWTADDCGHGAATGGATNQERRQGVCRSPAEGAGAAARAAAACGGSWAGGSTVDFFSRRPLQKELPGHFSVDFSSGRPPQKELPGHFSVDCSSGRPLQKELPGLFLVDCFSELSGHILRELPVASADSCADMTNWRHCNEDDASTTDFPGRRLMYGRTSD